MFFRSVVDLKLPLRARVLCVRARAFMCLCGRAPAHRPPPHPACLHAAAAYKRRRGAPLGFHVKARAGFGRLLVNAPASW